jgi:excisionase family DNA binding protein
MAEHGERYLTPEDLAALLQVTPRAVKEWRVKRYGPPFIRVGKHVRYLQSAVDDWARSQRSEAS